MKKIKKTTLLSLMLLFAVAVSAAPVTSVQTPYTISKVRGAQMKNKPVIVASSYEGVVVCYDYQGKLLWENPLSGFFNQDIYCADIDGDAKDEVLAANSDGTIYCLDDNGKLLWKFSPNSAPMNAVSVIHKDGKPYIAAGGYDKQLYYLTPKGEKISSVDAVSYSKEKGFGIDGPKEMTHIANFIRTLKRANGEEVLVLHGAINSMSARGGCYLFEPLATKPYKYVAPDKFTVYGAFAINDSDPKKGDRIMIGSTKDTRAGFIAELDMESSEQTLFSAYDLGGAKCGKFGYRVAQCEVMQIGGKAQHVMLFGSNILLPTYANTPATTEVLTCKYSFNDMAKDKTSTKLLLASAQSGGSSIHILDMNDKGWKKGYEQLEPKGKIASIIANSDQMRKSLSKFKLPKWEKIDSRPVVCFMSEGPNRDNQTKMLTDKITGRYNSPIFLNGGNSGGSENPASWSRDTMSNEFYKKRRDRRQKYVNTQAKVLQNTAKAFEDDSQGMSMWGGHGNDPFYYSLDTQKKIMSQTGKDQQTVLIFPEMEGRGSDVAWLMNNFIYPMAEHARQNNTKLFIRSKHIFWLGNVYEPHWHKLVSGEYADVFVPSMEETTDKSMELSVMGRMGMWMSGAVDSWGSRCARDNTSFDRLRQHSHQNLPNHFLRNMVYHISLGAQYLDNFKVDQEYMSLLWEMIAKGLLYVPKREEVVSLSPVRLSILEPDQGWLNEGNNAKWVCFYDEKSENENSWVMGRLNGSWPAAPTTPWDFSTYAAGAKERRLNFISSYNNGHVLLTPPTDTKAARGGIEQYLHPLYKGKTVEYFTDGRKYCSDINKTKSYSATEYYKTVENAIIEGSKLLPLTVKGEVGWVAAQSAPKHLRVTIIDGGYLNPSDKEATVVIGNAKVKSVTDLATGKVLEVKNGEVKVTVPCGLFTFLDVELAQELK